VKTGSIQKIQTRHTSLGSKGRWVGVDGV
jgi:hypothetical protein